MQNFGTLQQLLKIPPLSPQIYDSAGGRGVPEFGCCWNPSIFVSLILQIPQRRFAQIFRFAHVQNSTVTLLNNVMFFQIYS